MPTKTSTKALTFPIGGLSRQQGYQSQPPYTTPDALNVRPFDMLTGRMRGGSRPGLIKGFYGELGSGTPVRMLSMLTVIDQSGFTVWTDNFDGKEMGSVWSAIAPLAIDMPLITTEQLSVTYQEQGAAVRDSISDIDTAEPFTFEMFIVPYQGEHHGVYTIYGMLDDTSPDPEEDGFKVELTMTGSEGASTISITKYDTGSDTAIDSGTATDTCAQGGWFTVLVNDTTVTAYWLGEEVASGEVAGLSGTRVGFGIECTETGGICLVDVAMIQYYSDTARQEPRGLLCASAGGNLYLEGLSTRMSQVASGSGTTLNSSSRVWATQQGFKLYIADHGFIAGDIGVTIDDDGMSMHKADIDWDDYTGIVDLDKDHRVLLFDVTGAVTAGSYAITELGSGDGSGLTLGDGGAGGNGTASFSIGRTVKVYDQVADTLVNLAATAGTVPMGCRLIALYRDRLVLAGAMHDPHQWYMSRQGDPTDWDYFASSDDYGRAVSGMASNAGRLATPCTALATHSDDYLIFGAESSLRVLRGDPTYGGIIDLLSDTVGIISQGSWCHTPAGEFVFLSRDGLYYLPAGATSHPISMSRETLPNELLNVNSAMSEVCMSYDVRDRGIHIFIVSKDDKQRYHWFIDSTTKSIWPVLIPQTFEPTATLAYSATVPEEQHVILGGRDGYIRRFNKAALTDDGTEFESYVDFGPVALARQGDVGLLTSVSASMGETSGDVDWAARVGNTPEGAVSATAVESGTFHGGKNTEYRMRRRGEACVVRIASTGTPQHWSIENILLRGQASGRSRLTS